MGVLVLRGGDIAFEQYFNGHTVDSLHDIRSATKSITSLLAGIAIEQGLIDSVNAPVRDDVTIEHLLTMSSGLDADDSDPQSPGNESTWYEYDDWLGHLAILDVKSEPGRRWVYASANTFLLGVAIEDAAGMRLADFAAENLFTPLGISEFSWARNANGRTVGQGNLSLTLRDMASIGQLVLDEGEWNGERLVSAGWIRRSIKGRFEVPWSGYDEYGYSWYLHSQTIDGATFDYVFASGNGGNKIYVVPDLDMVVVIQSAAYNTTYGQRRSLGILTKVLTTQRYGECCASLAVY